MQPRLTRWIIVGSAIACLATEILVFLVATPPDATMAILGGFWLAMPYVLACAVAYLFRRHSTSTVTLAICFGLATFGGLSVVTSASIQEKQLEREVKNAVLPGEDPNAGPAAMRKSGAEFGATIGWGVVIVLAVFVPPIQSAIILIPTLIARAMVGKKEDAESTERDANQRSDY